MKEHKIVALSDIDHVRLKPGMYVGQVTPQERPTWILEESLCHTSMTYAPVTYSAAMVKLFDEVISNSIDEAYRVKRAPGEFTIRVTIVELENGGFSITVKDNGRGIPLKASDQPGLLMADLALCHLRAGSNFEADRDVSIGTHGLGVTLVNILSQRFSATIDDGKERYELACSRGSVISRSVTPFDTLQTGTTVCFEPDPAVFDTRHTQEALSVIRRRIYDLAACFPNIVFRLDGSIVQSRNFARYIAAIGSSELLPIHEARLTFQYENLKIGVISSDEPAAISFVNGIETYEGGSHLDYVRGKISDLLAAKLSKKHKIEVKPGDVKAKLLFVVVLDGLVNPSFRSQTKEYLSSPASSFTGLIQDFSAEDCVKKILSCEPICTSIVEAFILKKEAKDRAEARRMGSKLKKMNVAKLVPANSPNPKERILFLTEGDSAIGQLSNVRNPHIHGGFPLRGKVINAYKRSIKETFENNEVAQIAATLGITPGDNPDVDDIEYGRVVILSDADHDGSSIAAQLVNLFWTLWPKLIKGGVLWWLRPPIYKGKINGQVEYFYSEKEAQEAIKNGANLKYLKGLGSMNEEDYATMINNPRWSQIEVTDSTQDDITLAFGPDADQRKIWLRS